MVDEGLAASGVDAAVVVVTLSVGSEEEGEEVEVGREEEGGGVCAIMAPTLNMACCGMAPPCGCGMLCSIMGNIFSPFFALSTDVATPPACTAAVKPCGNPAAIIPEMGIPGIPLRRFCMVTMESMLPISAPFIKSGEARPEEDASETDRRGLGISLRGRRPRRRDPRSLFTGSVRMRENLASGR